MEKPHMNPYLPLFMMQFLVAFNAGLWEDNGNDREKREQEQLQVKKCS